MSTRPARPVRHALAAVGVAAMALSTAACGDDSAAEATPGGQSSASGASGASGAVGEAGLKAGTYTAEGEYQNPDGATSVGVEVTLDSAGVITAVEITPHAKGGNGALFQKLFAENIGDVVVGKPIAEADVDKVAGSSLTGAGFNAALDAIVGQASA
jgi:hypothetical protein